MYLSLGVEENKNLRRLYAFHFNAAVKERRNRFVAGSAVGDQHVDVRNRAHKRRGDRTDLGGVRNHNANFALVQHGAKRHAPPERASKAFHQNQH